MDSRYNHLEHEDRIYDLWESARAFNPDTYVQKTTGHQPFTIIMPPPNANDPLHIGHAMFVALEDALIRFHRMRGDDTLWLPGTDHAGIETQFVFEKKLKKEGKSRFNFDRKTLYQLIWDYVQQNSGVAVNQMKKLGASADWSRFKFTLDPDIVSTVLDTFIRLQGDGLIYRNQQLVNFCTHCGTSYSELEVNYVERTDSLYYVKYPFVDEPDQFITVATVRPELIFVDTHLAVNPTDSKNNHLLGKQVLNPLTDQPMTIIADEFVDPEFGSGIVKLSPAHDPHDFQVVQKHPEIPLNVGLGFDGKITPMGGAYAGLKVEAARAEVVKDLTKKGLIDQVKNDYSHRVGTCYRCGRVIEPLLRPQFFIKVKPLVEPVLKALDNNEVTIFGAGHDKILRHWLTNLRDWNISRQIVWGIRIPVWYPVAGNEDQLIVSFIDNKGDYHQGPLGQWLSEFELAEIKEGLQQVLALENVTNFVVALEEPIDQEYLAETDTFDTWFSSGQWPVATLQNTQPGDFERFYPTSVMETGYDILPFWVMRMLLFGYFLTDQPPFTEVYLHGLIRDGKGQKMSKSKGNVVNPLDMVANYGADALRMALVIRSTPGLDKSIGEGDFRAMRNLTNKIWNAARFVATRESEDNAGPKDEEMLKKLHEISATITQQLQDLKFGLAAETAYNEFWHWYCDECIELAKKQEISQTALHEGLITFIKLLHPFTPFVTEAVWQELPREWRDNDFLISAPWPTQGRAKT